MLRAIILYLAGAAWARRLMMRMPLAQRFSSRFVAGVTRADAIRAVQQLNQEGIHASLDNLGENTTSPAEARRATDEVVEMYAEINRAGVRANISIKLSQIGLTIADDLCRENLRRILEAARACGNFLRIDMEDTSLTQRTLDTYQWAREQGFENLGIVIQAYLYRSENDVRALVEQNIPIRLCKGAYREPKELAFPLKADTDANYDRLVAIMLQHAQAGNSPVASADGRFPPLTAVASHDVHRLQYAGELAQQLGLAANALEYQMLYGIRRDLQQKLAAEGAQVRVYVPYGTHWYPYFMRRLAERPANLWFILSNLLRK